MAEDIGTVRIKLVMDTIGSMPSIPTQSSYGRYRSERLESEKALSGVADIWGKQRLSKSERILSSLPSIDWSSGIGGKKSMVSDISMGFGTVLKASGLLGFIMTIAEVIKGGLEPFIKLATIVFKVLALMFLPLSIALVKIMQPLMKPLAEGIRNLVQAGSKSNPWEVLGGALAVGGIGALIGGPIGGMVGALVGSYAPLLADKAGELLGGFSDSAGSFITKVASEAGSAFKGIVDGLAATASKTLGQIWDGLKNAASGVWNTALSAWDTIKNAAGTAANTIAGVITGGGTKFSGSVDTASVNWDKKVTTSSDDWFSGVKNTTTYFNTKSVETIDMMKNAVVSALEAAKQGAGRGGGYGSPPTPPIVTPPGPIPSLPSPYSPIPSPILYGVQPGQKYKNTATGNIFTIKQVLNQGTDYEGYSWEFLPGQTNKHINPSTGLVDYEVPLVGGGTGSSSQLIQWLNENKMIRLFQFGGLVPETGMAMLHAGEKVIPRDEVRNSYGDVIINVNNATVKGSNDIRELTREISRHLQLELNRRTSYARGA